MLCHSVVEHQLQSGDQITLAMTPLLGDACFWSVASLVSITFILFFPFSLSILVLALHIFRIILRFVFPSNLIHLFFYYFFILNNLSNLKFFFFAIPSFFSNIRFGPYYFNCYYFIWDSFQIFLTISSFFSLFYQI